MRGLMSRMQNEKGNTLLLVLFLVFLLSAISAPLLLSLSQGNVNNKKGERIEQAQYAAESGMAIVKRVMEEAFYGQDMELNPLQVGEIINGVNKLPYMNTDLLEVSVTGPELKSKGDTGSGILNRKRVLTMNYLAQQGNDSVPGVFGKDVVSQYNLNGYQQGSFKENTGFLHPYPNFREEFTKTFASLMKSQPVGQVLDVQANSNVNAVCAAYPGILECSGNNIKIRDVNGSVTINASIITPGDIIIEKRNDIVTVKGDLAAGGSIRATNDNFGLDVSGSIFAKSYIDFNRTIKSIYTGGSIYSQADLTFGQINDKIEIMGSLIADGKVEFSKVNNTRIHKDISTKKALIISNGINSNGYALTVDGSIYINNPNASEGVFTVSGNTDKMVVGGSVLSSGTIKFNGVINSGGLTLTNGAMLTLGNIEFGDHVNNMNVKQTVGCLGNLTFRSDRYFNNNLYFGGASIGGSYTSSQYQQSNPGSPHIVINYNPPVAGGGQKRILQFTNWEGANS
jgi:hypothetical protein